MDQIDIFNKVKHIIVHELNKDKQLVDIEGLKNDLNFDSLDQALLAVALEQNFKIRISDEESEKLMAVAEIVGLIQNKLGIKK